MKNIAEILKDCPKGTKLYSPLCGECTFEEIDKNIIFFRMYTGNLYAVNSDGSYCKGGECLLFPSKENRNWNNFIPFKDGDIIFEDRFHSICIFKKEGSIKGTVDYYTGMSFGGFYVKDEKNIDEHFGDISYYRLANEEEKQKLFKAIKDNGSKWNTETKTLEKLKKEKFDISTLKPFDKVLVRDNNNNHWRCNYFSHINKPPFIFTCTDGNWKQCIPYEGNEHLVGTTNDCDDYYKTW